MDEVSITLRAEALLWLEEILVDEDGGAALEFLRRVIEPEVERRQKARMRPETEQLRG